MRKINILEIKFIYDGNENKIYPIILEDENEMILVDCGYPNFLSLIEEEAINKGIDIKRLSKIIITHHDYDHMGSLAEFKRKYPNIQVLASREDMEFISGKKKSLRLKQAEAIYNSLSEEEKKAANVFHKVLESVETCDVDIGVEDKEFIDCCGGIEVITTPGHMPGHISLYVKECKTLIAGDALVIENDELAIAMPQYTLNRSNAINSIKKLRNYDVNKIVCYHGGEYIKDIKKSLEKVYKDNII